MEALRGVVSCTIGASKFSERGRSLVDRILGVSKAAPVATIDEEDRHWES